MTKCSNCGKRLSLLPSKNRKIIKQFNMTHEQKMTEVCTNCFIKNLPQEEIDKMNAEIKEFYKNKRRWFSWKKTL